MTALGSDVESVERATARCQRIVTASVRHHEAQHSLDHDHGLRHPPALAPYVGLPTGDLALRARFELSAYLSQIASDVWLPQPRAVEPDARTHSASPTSRPRPRPTSRS